MKTSSKIYSLIAGLSALPFIALAQTDKLTSVASNFLKTINVVVTIVFVLAILIFGWGIVRFISAAGDAEKIKKAKSMIVWGVIGIAVLASVFGLISFLQDYFGVGAGGGNIVVPGVTGNARTP